MSTSTPSSPSRSSFYSSSPSAAAPSSPPPSRSPSPPLHTPNTGSSLHRRQLSARKERDGAGLEPRRLQHTTGPLATSHLPTFASSPSSFTSPLPLSHPRVSTTPLLLSTAQSSSFSTLPYYRSPSILVPNSPPHSTAQSLVFGYPKVEEIKEEPRAQSLGLTAATDSNPSFRAFVASNAYTEYEAEVVNNVDLLRRSNALNEDTADYVLILQPDHAAEDAVDEAAAEKEEVEMIIRQAERTSLRPMSPSSPSNTLRTPDRRPPPPLSSQPSSSVCLSPESGPRRKRSNPLPPLPTLTFSDLSIRFSSRARLEPGRPNSAVLIERLRGAGLDVRVDSLRLGGKVLLRLSASSTRLEEEAEKMKMKLRVRHGGWRKFDRSIRDHFIGSGDAADLFRSCERQIVIDHIIRTKQSDGGAGIGDQYASLIADRFPLHMHARLLSLQPWLSFWKLHAPSPSFSASSPSIAPSSSSSSASSPSWCFSRFRPVARLFSQPLSSISAYYGETVAFYFAFLGFYTVWLCIPTVMGLALFLSQLSHTSLDSPLVPFFSLLMALWASFFIEQWRRREAVLANEWGVWQMDVNDEEVTRPEYRGQMQRHEVTGEIHRVYPMRKRVKKLIIAFVLCFTLVAGFSALILQLFMEQDKYFGTVKGLESVSTTHTPSLSAVGVEASLDMLFVPVVWGFLIPLGELLFNTVAQKLTDWENWRTPSMYHNGLILKIFSFRFLNSFLALYYYAFADLGILRLTTSVASFLCIGSAFRFFIYTVCPTVHRRIIDRVMERKVKQANTTQQQQRGVVLGDGGVSGGAVRALHSRPLSLSCGWRESAHLSYDTFEDYCNLVIQFGYVSFFSVAFPLAPLLALLTNIVEIRAGAYKLLHVYRRPLAVRRPGIGVWLSVLQVMSVIAVLTNCALIGFTSQQIDNWVPNVSPAVKIVIIFLFEHVVIAVKFVIHSYLFSVPRAVQLDMQREKFDSDRSHRQWVETKRKEKQQQQLAAAEHDANRYELGC